MDMVNSLANQSATLAWTVSGIAPSLSLSSGIGPVSGSSIGVTPAQTTTYTLTATNLGGTVTQQVTLGVMAITAFTATPAALVLGSSSCLSWTVAGGSGVSVSLAPGPGPVPAVGAPPLVVTPTVTTTYTLTATCAQGTLTSVLTLGVNAPVINSFQAVSPIVLGAASTLSWSVTGAASLSIPGIGNVTGSSLAVTPTATTTYTLEAADSSGEVLATTTVVVVPPPRILSFVARPASVVAGGNGTMLNWDVVGAETMTVNSGVGTVTGSGVLVNPATSTTYTLTVSNQAGTVTATCNVAVVQAPVIRVFAAACPTLAAGNSTSLVWAVDGATAMSLTGVSSVTMGVGSATVTPTTTTTYQLTASNAQGTTTASVTVTVAAPATVQTPVLVWSRTLVYGFGQLLSEETPSGTTYVQSDQVGSPNLLTDVNGNVVGKTKNLPFGERLDQLGVTSFRRYTNHEDGPGSPIYMQARTYLPAYGKFAQVDPAYDQTKHDPETWNLYTYVTNNPVTCTDRTEGRALAEVVTTRRAP